MSALKDTARAIAHRLYDLPGARALLPLEFWIKAGVVDPWVRLFRSLNPSGMRVAPGASPRVLFLRMRFVPRLGTTELVLAKQLAEDGAQPVFAYCSPLLPACNGWDVRAEDPRAVCERCHRNNRLTASMSPFDSYFLAEFITEQDRQEARVFAADIGVEDLVDLKVEGLELGNEMFRSLAKFLFRGDVPRSPENLRLAREFAQSAFILVRALNRMFDDVNPDVVVMNAGHVMWYGIAYKILKRRGIRTVTFDETNIAVTSLTWDFDDANPCIDYVWDEYWTQLKDDALSSEQEREVEDLLAERSRRFLYEPAEGLARVGDVVDLSRYRSVFSAFTNVPWDATIVGKDIVFSSMQEWLQSTIEVAERYPDVGLLVRVHPAEAGVYGMVSRERVAARLKQWRAKLPPNVHIIDAEEKVDSYSLIAASDGVLVYCSNVGLEAILMGKATLVSGAAHYRGKGLARDIETPEEFTAAFEAWCENPPEAPNRTHALRYAYLAFFDTQINLGLFDDTHPHQAANLAVSDLGRPLTGTAGATFRALSAWIRDADIVRGPFTNRRFLKGGDE